MKKSDLYFQLFIYVIYLSISILYNLGSKDIANYLTYITYFLWLLKVSNFYYNTRRFNLQQIQFLLFLIGSVIFIPYTIQFFDFIHIVLGIGIGSLQLYSLMALDETDKIKRLKDLLKKKKSTIDG